MDGEIKQPGLFEVTDLIGEGTFAKVIKCVNRKTGEMIALKALNKSKHRDFLFQRELDMLKAIRGLDPDTYNIIRFIDILKIRKNKFLAFEMLDISVMDLIKNRGRKTFALDEIRLMAKQLLVALEALRRIGIMHTDIKPENIMLVDHENQPFRVKLIDFGVALHNSEAKIGMGMQPLAYVAPEVILGLPLTEAVDMWSLACCLAEWYVGCCILDGCSYYDKLKKFTQLIGTPDDELLNKAVYTTQYFVQEGSQWRLKTLQECQDTQGKNPIMLESRLDAARDLEDAITNFSLEQTCPEFQDMRAFLDLLKKMFNLDPEKRITPSEALRHPFITMDHLKSAEQAGSLLTCTPTQLDSHEDEGIQNNQEQQRSHDEVSKSPPNVKSECSGGACGKEETMNGTPDRPNEDGNFGPRGEVTSCQPTNQKQHSPVNATNSRDKSLEATDSSSYQSADQQEKTQPPKATKRSLNKKSSSLTSTSGPVNCQPTNQETSGTDSSHLKDNEDTGICQHSNQRPERLSQSAGDVPESSPSKSPGPSRATSEEVRDPKPMIYEPSRNQCVIGDITVQNDERKCTSPSKNDNSKSAEPSNAATFKHDALASPLSVEQTTAAHNTEEKTDGGTSSDTATLHPKRPSVENTNQHSPCHMVKTKIRVEVQQSGAWKRRTLRITIKT